MSYSNPQQKPAPFKFHLTQAVPSWTIQLLPERLKEMTYNGYEASPETAKTNTQNQQITSQVFPSRSLLPFIDLWTFCLTETMHLMNANAQIRIAQELSIIIHDHMKVASVEIINKTESKTAGISKTKWRRFFLNRAARKISDLSRVTDSASSAEEGQSPQPDTNLSNFHALDYFDFSFVE